MQNCEKQKNTQSNPSTKQNHQGQKERKKQKRLPRKGEK
jgi:hypothetical protein